MSYTGHLTVNRIITSYTIKAHKILKLPFFVNYVNKESYESE